MLKAKVTANGVTANLSTTPSSLQIMLKLSPAVGTPGIMTRGVKTALLRAKVHVISFMSLSARLD